MGVNMFRLVGVHGAARRFLLRMASSWRDAAVFTPNGKFMARRLYPVLGSL